MLYTVIPLERIYVDQRAEDKKTIDETDAEYKDLVLKHGRVVTRRDGDNYVVQRINSTDMRDYLNEEYSPGKIIKH
ncbi:MAG: hypothetical protein GX319_09220 [Clostridiales bacterium]|jgi:hypothetical protein|nr:YlzJ-like family protein [Bacillota bacterium]NLK04567.1 hypothetical protein [Clostridiales bacterium]